MCLMQVEGSYIGNGLKRMMWSDSRSCSIHTHPTPAPASLGQPALYQPLDITCRIPAGKMKTPVRVCQPSLLLHKRDEMICL